jgi:integrase
MNPSSSASRAGSECHRPFFSIARQKSQLTDFRFHDLRHTFATRLVVSGDEALTIAALRGRKTLSRDSKIDIPQMTTREKR